MSMQGVSETTPVAAPTLLGHNAGPELPEKKTSEEASWKSNTEDGAGGTALPTSAAAVSEDVAADHGELPAQEAPPQNGFREQLICACGQGQLAGPLMLMILSPYVYLTNFHADPTIFSVVLIVLIIYDLLNIYPIAVLSDSGRLNKWLNLPLESWGRRAPFAVVAFPIMAISFSFMWLGPLLTRATGVFAIMWFVAMKFLAVTGVSMFTMSATTSTNELFPSKPQRSTLAVYLSAIQLVCGICSLVIAGSFLLSASRGSAAETNILCAVAIGSVVFLCAVIPHSRVMRKTCMVTPAESPRLKDVMTLVLANGSARNLMFGRFLTIGSNVVLTFTLPFYLQYVCKVSKDELGMANSIVVANVILTRILFLPVYNWFVKRYCPARLVVICMIFSVSTGVPFALLSFAFEEWRWLLIVGFVLAIASQMADIVFRVLLGFVSDEDQVKETIKGRSYSIERNPEGDGCEDFLAPRRDGLFWCGWSFFEMMAQFYVGIGSLLFAMAGYDPKLDEEGQSQPVAVTNMITVFFIGGVALNYSLTALALSRFSLKGKRLLEVQEQYGEIFAASQKMVARKR